MGGMESPLIAWSAIGYIARALEGLASVEEERIVHVDTVAHLRSTIEGGAFGADLGVGVPHSLGDIGLEEADPIEEEAIL